MRDPSNDSVRTRMPRTQYAKSGDVHVAYQVFGDGPIDLVFVPGFISHIENYWTEPACVRWLTQIGGFARVVMFDKRGTGLSDRLEGMPGMDDRMDDVRAVMDAAGMERAAVFGISEGGSLATLFAASHPERCTALVLYGAFACFRSWFPTDEAFEEFLAYVDEHWGSGASLPAFAPSRADDPGFQEWWGRFERMGASPAAAKHVMRVNKRIDLTDILSSVRVPTLVLHRTDDVTVDVEAGRALAAGIEGAQYVEMPGADHIPFVGDSARVVHEIAQFLTGSTSNTEVDRVLSTLLFTDIVDSTARADALGDSRWGDLLARHNRITAAAIARFRGQVVKSTGDGVLARFDGPARAVRCAMEARDAAQELGLEVRAGVHTGEVQITDDDDVHGISVHVAARIMARAPAGSVLVSRTVKDLVAGSGFRFADAGTHQFKGVPDNWELLEVAGLRG